MTTNLDKADARTTAVERTFDLGAYIARLKMLHEQERIYFEYVLGLPPYVPPPPRPPRTTRRSGSSRERMIQRIAERDGWLCYLCQTELSYSTAELEHIIARANGGSEEKHNLALACSPCNLHKSNNIVSYDLSSGRYTYTYPTRSSESKSLRL